MTIEINLEPAAPSVAAMIQQMGDKPNAIAPMALIVVVKFSFFDYLRWALRRTNTSRR
jgi:hypothetical protein